MKYIPFDENKSEDWRGGWKEREYEDTVVEEHPDWKAGFKARWEMGRVPRTDDEPYVIAPKGSTEFYRDGFYADEDCITTFG